MDDLSARCSEVASACLCFNLRRTTRLLTQLYDEHLRPTGLKTTQLSVLVGSSIGGSAPLARLAGRLGMDRTTLTRNLKTLESRGLVTRRTGADRRVHLVEVTPEGTALLREALPLWRSAQDQATTMFGAESSRALLPLLTDLADRAQGVPVRD